MPICALVTSFFIEAVEEIQGSTIRVHSHGGDGGAGSSGVLIHVTGGQALCRAQESRQLRIALEEHMLSLRNNLRNRLDGALSDPKSWLGSSPANTPASGLCLAPNAPLADPASADVVLTDL